MVVTIPFRLPDLNDYIRAIGTHKQAGAKFKDEICTQIEWALKTQIKEPLREPVIMDYTWYEPNRRRDRDNISSFGRKVIQDAMMRLGVLSNDGWRTIYGFSDSFIVDKNNPHVLIEITELGTGKPKEGGWDEQRRGIWDVSADL